MLILWIFFFGLASAGSLTDLLADELDRANTHFNTLDEKPHYIALGLTEETSVEIAAQDGATSPTRNDDLRMLDIDVRVGTAELDSTHQLRGFSGFEGSRRTRIQLPAETDDSAVIRHVLWRELDQAYRGHSERIVMLRANQIVKVEEEDSSPDFEPRSSSSGRGGHRGFGGMMV